MFLSRLWVLKFSYSLSNLRILENKGEISFRECKKSFCVRYQNSILFSTRKILMFGVILSVAHYIFMGRGINFGVGERACLFLKC